MPVISYRSSGLGTTTPGSPDVEDLGSVDREWRRLFLGDQSNSLQFGIAQDVVMGRVAANVVGLAAGDSFRVPSDGELQIGADTGLRRVAADILGPVAGDSFRVASGGLQVRNPADTFSYTIVGGAITGNRNVTLPFANLDLTVAMLEIAQVFTARIDSTFQHTWSAGEATTASFYQIGRDADGVNQMHFNVPTGAAWEWSVNDVAVMFLGATALNPGVNDGRALGTNLLSWADLFLAPGAVINIGDGNLTMTQSAGAMTATGAWTFSGASVNITGATGNTLVVDTNVLVVDATNNRVGIGTTGPVNKLDVSGGMAIGSYSGVNTAPVNGLIISGSVGIGTANPLTAFHLAQVTPQIFLEQTGASVDNKIWDIRATAEGLRASAINDLASASSAWLEVERTGTTIDSVAFPNGNVGAGTATFGTGATKNFALGGGVTSPVIGAALADVVHLAAVDFAVGDRRLVVQSELGSIINIGNNTVRATWATQAAADATVDLGSVTGTTYSLVRITSSLRHKEIIGPFGLDSRAIYGIKLVDWESRTSDYGRRGYSPIAEYAYKAHPSFAQLDEQGLPIGINWPSLNTAMLNEVQSHEERLNYLEPYVKRLERALVGAGIPLPAREK